MAREAPYLEVADDLRERIKRGEWSPGDRMPSRAHLAREYGVGRNVTQRAVDRLIVEGLLEGRAGSGTFVRLPRERRRMVRSRHRERTAEGMAAVALREFGRKLAPETHSQACIPAPGNIAARLGIPVGELCVRTTYEFLIDRQPVQLCESWEPMSVTADTNVVLPELGPIRGIGVVERMQRIGVQVETAVEVPRPGRATATEAALLGIAPGDLLLHIERTYYATDGRAVETADITVPDVRWEIAYEIDPHD
jgi:GntR family transcriptional regulator